MDSSIGISHRRVMSIALPIVLSNISIPILGAIDTGVIGQLGNAVAIGAVGIGAIILSKVRGVTSNFAHISLKESLPSLIQHLKSCAKCSAVLLIHQGR